MPADKNRAGNRVSGFRLEIAEVIRVGRKDEARVQFGFSESSGFRQMESGAQQFRDLTITLSFRTSYPNFLYRSCASLVIKTPRRPAYSGNDSI